jgi:hypothetical protein
MRKSIHEGLNPANQEAENISFKTKTDTFVTKENIGGLKYVVYTNRHSIPEGAKVLSIYSKGNKLDSMPEEKPVVIPQRPPQIEPVKPASPEAPAKIEETKVGKNEPEN